MTETYDRTALQRKVFCQYVQNVTLGLQLLQFRRFAQNFTMYPIQIVQPMKEELTEFGFKEMLDRGEVENQLKTEGTTLVMINSVCGCSAGTARPGVLMAVTNAS